MVIQAVEDLNINGATARHKREDEGGVEPFYLDKHVLVLTMEGTRNLELFLAIMISYL